MPSKPSRGYLITWLGALAGMGIILILSAVFVSASSVCNPQDVSCLLDRGWIADARRVVFVLVQIVGLAIGPYVALRLMRREVAGLTAATFVAICAAMVGMNSVVGPVLEGTTWDDPWAALLAAGAIFSPLGARAVALAIGRSLRKYL